MIAIILKNATVVKKIFLYAMRGWYRHG